MKRFIYPLIASLALSTQAFAFDFGTFMQNAAPVTQALAPVADQALLSNPMVKTISTNLNVTPTQAVGGSAAILKDATSRMNPTDVKSLKSQLPAIGTLLASAPATQTALPAQFSALGLSSDMIGKFTPFILQYVTTGTTPQLAQVVQAALMPTAK